MVEICPANRTNAHRFAVSKARRSLLRAPSDAGDRVFGRFRFYQRAVRSMTIVHQLILRVLPCAKFYQTIFEMASKIFLYFSHIL
jgi:hypothetical protein